MSLIIFKQLFQTISAVLAMLITTVFLLLIRNVSNEIFYQIFLHNMCTKKFGGTANIKLYYLKKNFLILVFLQLSTMLQLRNSNFFDRILAAIKRERKPIVHCFFKGITPIFRLVKSFNFRFAQRVMTISIPKKYFGNTTAVIIFRQCYFRGQIVSI